MADVFRILDRFNVTLRGTVYAVKNYFKSDVRIGNILYDLHGNRFLVKSIAMYRLMPGVKLEDVPLGLIIELLDGTDAEGDFLLRHPNDINFLFCSHPLDSRTVDEDYAEEYEAAKAGHRCALFSYEELETGKLRLYGDDISGLAIYRGWMMKPELYPRFYQMLEEIGIILINTPEEYEKYHLLPGWYEDFKDVTPFSVWEDKGNITSAMSLTRDLKGSYIVKDYVKSRKHEWYDACFIQNTEDKINTERIIRNFIERQGEELVGGVVLRKFEKLKADGYHEISGMPLSEEYRVFILAGRIMIAENYWRSDRKTELFEEDRSFIESLVKKLKSQFVTMDLARREDGKLIVMELGDGQVSGLQQIKLDVFYKSLNPTKSPPND